MRCSELYYDGSPSVRHIVVPEKLLIGARDYWEEVSPGYHAVAHTRLQVWFRDKGRLYGYPYWWPNLGPT